VGTVLNKQQPEAAKDLVQDAFVQFMLLKATLTLSKFDLHPIEQTLLVQRVTNHANT